MVKGVAWLLVGEELALTAGSASSIETEPEAEPEIDIATLGEEKLRAELVKVRLHSKPTF